MRVFLTGASGFIGSAVVQELLAAGHQVLGLARSDKAAKSLTAVGVEVHRGDLEDTDSLARGAAAADGIIHTAFIHDDLTKVAVYAQTDQRAIAAMATALEGTHKPLVTASATAMLARGTATAVETMPAPEDGPRAPSEKTMLAAAERGVRTSVVRLPPSVHGAGDHAFVPMLINVARQKGFAAFVGDGANRWPVVHRLDAARLFRLALEKAKPGTRLHAVAEEGIPMRSLAEAIGQGLGVPARALPSDEVAAHFAWMSHFITLDNPTSSALTRGSMAWSPREAGLLDDMKKSGYFAAQ